MIKLYKREGSHVVYWEAWELGSGITVHWGTVGDCGQSIDVSILKGELSAEAIRRLAAPKLKEGYAPIDDDEHDALIVQYPIVGMGKSDDLKFRHEMEDFLNQEIGWLGAGRVDGGDIGSGTMNVWAYVVEGATVAEKLIEPLKSRGRFDQAVVAVRKADTDDFVVVWPKHFTGVFLA